MRLLSETDLLTSKVHTSHYDRNLQGYNGSESLERLADLEGQLACGRETEGEQVLWLVEKRL